MSATLLAAIRRSFLLLALACVGATLAFGTVMLAVPPTSEAAVSENGDFRSISDCELLPIGDVNSCLVQR